MSTIKLQRAPRLAIAIVVIASLLVVALLTPQGRSFAQSILAFFTRADSTRESFTAERIVNPPASLSSLGEVFMTQTSEHDFDRAQKL